MGVFCMHEKHRNEGDEQHMMKAYHPAFPAAPLLFYKLFPVPDPPTKCISLLFPSSMKYNKGDRFTKEDL